MELYLLDENHRRVVVLEKYISIIWAERYKVLGDFELHTPSTNTSRLNYAVGAHLTHRDTHRVMVIETVEDKTDQDGRRILVVRGRSIERILLDRVAKSALVAVADAQKWSLGPDKPADIARYVYHQICQVGILSLSDRLLDVTEGTILPASTVPEPSEDVLIALDPMTLYDALKYILDPWDVGFRILLAKNGTGLYFDVYSGIDRTSDQTLYPTVIFSPELENLQNTNEFKTSASFKNVAYVYTDGASAVVYSEGDDATTIGMNRRVLMVNATDIKDSDPPNPSALTAALIQRGNEELAQHRKLAAFDGEVSQNSNYVYGVDYQLGDLVEMRNDDGVVNKMRVVEQIFVSDAEGERSYPTLAINQFVEPGTWLSWEYNSYWSDMGANEYWSTT